MRTSSLAITAVCVASLAAMATFLWLRSNAPAPRPRASELQPGPPAASASPPARRRPDPAPAFAVPPPAEGAARRGGGDQAANDEARRRWLETFRRAEAQPRDAGWAGKAEGQLQKGIAGLGNVGFTVDAVECRSSACVVGVAWSDNRTASADMQALATLSLDVDCATTVMPLESGGGPLRAKLLLDGCAR